MIFDDFCQTIKVQAEAGANLKRVSRNDELWIKNEELWIKNEELWIKNEGLWIKNEGFCTEILNFADEGQ